MSSTSGLSSGWGSGAGASWWVGAGDWGGGGVSCATPIHANTAKRTTIMTRCRKRFTFSTLLCIPMIPPCASHCTTVYASLLAPSPAFPVDGEGVWGAVPLTQWGEPYGGGKIGRLGRRPHLPAEKVLCCKHAHWAMTRKDTPIPHAVVRYGGKSEGIQRVSLVDAQHNQAGSQARDILDG
jgi:hypothetical protein